MKTENIMEKMFGKYVETDMTSISNRINEIINETQKGNVVQRDPTIELMKEQADIKKFKNIEFLSIIIPSYNRFDFLIEVVNSIHENADIPFELIIHDDNSNDGTKESLENLYNKTSTIIYSNGLNLGLAESINRAVRLASSEYILMLNADIVIDKPFFKDILNVLKCPFVGFINIITPFPDAKNKMKSKDTLFSLHRGIGGGCALGFTKTVFNNVDGWNSSSCRSGNADVSFMIKTIKNGYFPVNLSFDKAPIRLLDIDNKRSTIGRIQYDCSYPRLFNFKSYEDISLERSSITNDFMQYSYRVDEGETNINYWSKFCHELIDEDNCINFELCKIYGHDRWLKYRPEIQLIYKRNKKIEYDVGNLLRNLFENYYISQNFSELEWLTEKVKELNPTVILEVGIESGGTLKVWEQLLQQDNNSILIGIDLGLNIAWKIEDSKVNIHLVKGNSHDISTLDKVKEILGDRKVDFVYIDGEHTSQAAKQDFEMYGSLVRRGGLVGFHDIGDVRDFLSTLPQDRLQKFSKNPPFDKQGFQMTIGTGIYYV